MSESKSVHDGDELPDPLRWLDPNIFRNAEDISPEKVASAVRKILLIFLHPDQTDEQIIHSIHAILGPNPGNVFVREVMIRIAFERNQDQGSTHHIGRALRLLNSATGAVLKAPDIQTHFEPYSGIYKDIFRYAFEGEQFDILAALQSISEMPIHPGILRQRRDPNKVQIWYEYLPGKGGRWTWRDDFLGLVELSGMVPTMEIANTVFCIILEKRTEQIFLTFDMLVRAGLDPAALQKKLDRQIAYHLDIPSLYSQRYTQLSSLEHPGCTLTNIPWGAMYNRLDRANPPSSRTEYNPWATDLDPLVKNACRTGVLDQTKKDDADIIFSFVQTYGMYNIPTALRWHTTLSRVRDLSELPKKIKADIEKTLGIKVSTLKQKGDIARAIERFRLRLQSELLADRIPKEILTTDLGLDFFLALKGVTEWETDDHPREILARLTQTKERNPEASRLHKGYTELAMSVPMVEKRPADEIQEIEATQNKLLQNPIINTGLDEFWDAHQLVAQNDTYTRTIVPYLSDMLAEIQKDIDSVTNSKAALKDLTETKKWIVRYCEGLAELKGDYFIENTPIAMNNALSLPKTPYRDRILRAMSALHGSVNMNDIMRSGINERVAQLRDPDKRHALVMFTAEYIRNVLFELVFSGNPWEISIELDAELMDLWHYDITAPEYPFLSITKQLARLERQKYRMSAKTRDISMVPVKGPLLAYAGDVGDACYTDFTRILRMAPTQT